MISVTNTPKNLRMREVSKICSYILHCLQILQANSVSYIKLVLVSATNKVHIMTILHGKVNKMDVKEMFFPSPKQPDRIWGPLTLIFSG